MRKKGRQKNGFSLTEVLLAIGTLAVGMILVAGAFPVGIHFTTVAAERTMASVVADEAFAKIRMIAASPHPNDPNLPSVSAEDFAFTDSNSFQYVANMILMPWTGPLDRNVFAYPSLDEVAPEGKSYFWSAICRRAGLSDIQVTVFVSRKVGLRWSYRFRDPRDDSLSPTYYPEAIYFGVMVAEVGGAELIIQDIHPDEPEEHTLINEGYMIVDDVTGDIYRVVERYMDNPATGIDEASIILLDRQWQGDRRQRIWAVPAAAGGIRYPCIAVYQKVLRL